MSEEAQSGSDGSPLGGCALASGAVFVLAAILYPILLVLIRSYEPEMLFLPLGVGGLAFLIGHLLALVALGSKAEKSRKRGKRALRVMWGGVALWGGLWLVETLLERLSGK